MSLQPAPKSRSEPGRIGSAAGHDATVVKRVDDLEQHPTRHRNCSVARTEIGPVEDRLNGALAGTILNRRDRRYRMNSTALEPARPSGGCAPKRTLQSTLVTNGRTLLPPQNFIYRYWKFSTGARLVKHWSIH